MFRGGEDVLTRGKAEIRVGRCHVRYTYTAELFNDFIDGLLDNMNPFPGRNSVIIMDNASIHKSEVLRPMIEARYEYSEHLDNT